MLNRFSKVNCVNEKFYTDALFSREIEEGLSRSVKSVPSRWLYDAEGSRLFTEITKLPEYDLTRVETSILREHAAELAQVLIEHLGRRQKLKVVELGAGDGSKTEIVLSAFVEAKLDFDYCPIDVSATALETLCARMTRAMPVLTCHSIIGDNLESLAQLNKSRAENERLLILDLG